MTFGSLVQSHASDERFEDGAQGWNIDQLAGPGGPVVQYGCTRAAGTGRERCRSASAHCWVLRERAFTLGLLRRGLESSRSSHTG